MIVLIRDARYGRREAGETDFHLREELSCGTSPAANLKDSITPPGTVPDRLCTACALCCNGVLFADVRLQPGDDAARLKQLGAALKQWNRGARFTQPCSCLDGNACRIYVDRPGRCRTFECRVLKRALHGELSDTAALKLIREARRRADEVRRVLEKLGDRDEALPLSRRYRRMMRQPIDLAAGERIGNLRGKLMLAVARLAEMLEREFLA